MDRKLNERRVSRFSVFPSVGAAFLISRLHALCIGKGKGKVSDFSVVSKPHKTTPGPLTSGTSSSTKDKDKQKEKSVVAKRPIVAAHPKSPAKKKSKLAVPAKKTVVHRPVITDPSITGAQPEKRKRTVLEETLEADEKKSKKKKLKATKVTKINRDKLLKFKAVFTNERDRKSLKIVLDNSFAGAGMYSFLIANTAVKIVKSTTGDQPVLVDPRLCVKIKDINTLILGLMDSGSEISRNDFAGIIAQSFDMFCESNEGSAIVTDFMRYVKGPWLTEAGWGLLFKTLSVIAPNLKPVMSTHMIEFFRKLIFTDLSSQERNAYFQKCTKSHQSGVVTLKIIGCKDHNLIVS